MNRVPFGSKPDALTIVYARVIPTELIRVKHLKSRTDNEDRSLRSPEADVQDYAANQDLGPRPYDTALFFRGFGICVDLHALVNFNHCSNKITMPEERKSYWQRLWVQRAVCRLLAQDVGSLAVTVSPSLRLLARNVSPKHPLFAGLGAAVCRPLQLTHRTSH